MATLIQINVINNSPSTQNFFFFQQPAIYTGGQQVYSNSLLTASLAPYATSGGVYTFLLNLQYFAGVQDQISQPVVGQPSGYNSAIQMIGLTPAAGGTPSNNTTTMSASPLGLSVPVNTTGVQPGAFRIISPVFNPTLKQYNGGSAVSLPNGGVVLSNFVSVSPNANLDCQPVLKFYVQTGSYTAGTVMNFTSSSATAALCDATSGFTTFNVSYNADGTWTVTPSVSRTVLTASTGDSHSHADSLSAPALNAEIRNEAGTAVISQGYAANFNDPTTITQLTAPGAIAQYNEYQVGPVGGAMSGKMCTAINGNTATFS